MEVTVGKCLECHRVCLETATHALEQGGRLTAASHVRLLLDCAAI